MKKIIIMCCCVIGNLFAASSVDNYDEEYTKRVSVIQIENPTLRYGEDYVEKTSSLMLKHVQGATSQLFPEIRGSFYFVAGELTGVGSHGQSNSLLTLFTKGIKQRNIMPSMEFQHSVADYISTHLNKFPVEVKSCENFVIWSTCEGPVAIMGQEKSIVFLGEYAHHAMVFSCGKWHYLNETTGRGHVAKSIPNLHNLMRSPHVQKRNFGFRESLV